MHNSELANRTEVGFEIGNGTGDRDIVLSEEDKYYGENDRDADSKERSQRTIHPTDDRLLLGNRVATVMQIGRRRHVTRVAGTVAKRTDKRVTRRRPVRPRFHGRRWIRTEKRAVKTTTGGHRVGSVANDRFRAAVVTANDALHRRRDGGKVFQRS